MTGEAVNITWDTIRILEPTFAAIYANVFKEHAQESSCALPVSPRRQHWLTARNFTYRNVVATTDTYAGCFLCGPDRPCTDFTFDNVTVHATGGGFKCFNVFGHAVDSAPRPCFKEMNGRGLLHLGVTEW